MSAIDCICLQWIDLHCLSLSLSIIALYIYYGRCLAWVGVWVCLPPPLSSSLCACAGVSGVLGLGMW
jgi:hypothetical protein